MKRTNYVISALVIGIGVLFLLVGRNMKVFSLDGITDARTWPNGLAWVLIGLGALLALSNRFGKKADPSAAAIDYRGKEFFHVAQFILLIAVYGIMFYVLGCVLANLIFIPVFMIFFGERKWKVIVVYDIILAVSIYFLFEKLLMSPLARPIFL